LSWFPKNEEVFDEAVLKLSKACGKVFAFDFFLIFGTKVIVLADLDLTKKVLQTCLKSFLCKELQVVLGEEGLVLSLGGEAWAMNQKMFNRGFPPTFLKDINGHDHGPQIRAVFCQI